MKKADGYSLYLAGLTSDYEMELNENAPPSPPNPPAPPANNGAAQQVQAMKAKLISAVDSWVNEILASLKAPSSNKPMGLWDRFKSGLSNLWHGRDNVNNPNYWRNRYGDDMGVEAQQPKKESISNRMSFRQYHEMKSIVDGLERSLTVVNEAEFDNLKIVQMIKQAGERLKGVLSNIVDGKDPAPPTQPPSGGPKGPDGNPPNKAGATANKSSGGADGSSGGPTQPPSGGPKGPDGNPPNKAGATAARVAGGSEGDGGSSDPDSPDAPSGPQGPEDKAGVMKILDAFNKAMGERGGNSEKQADLLYKSNIKSATELMGLIKEIYNRVKAAMEKMGKETPEFDNLSGVLLQLVNLKLEHGEGKTMKDMIYYFTVGYLLITDNLKDTEKASGRDFMSVVDYAKKSMGEGGGTQG